MPSELPPSARADSEAVIVNRSSTAPSLHADKPRFAAPVSGKACLKALTSTSDTQRPQRFACSAGSEYRTDVERHGDFALLVPLARGLRCTACQIVAHVDDRHALLAIKHVMHHADGLEPLLRPLECGAHRLIVELMRLHLDQAAGHLQIVLHAVMDFLEQRIALRHGSSERAGGVSSSSLRARASRASSFGEPHQRADHDVSRSSDAS